MNSPSLENDIKEFYQQVELPDDAVESILDSGHFASVANRWQRIAIASMIGMAAMTLLSVSLFLSKPQEINEIALANSKKKLELTPAMLNKNENRQPKKVIPANKVSSFSTKKYRLVAVRSHGHGCPHCRETKEVFDKLENEMINAPLHFTDLQMNTPESAEKVKQLSIQPLVAGRAETAFIALTTLDGTKVREFKPSMGLKRIRQSIQEIISRQ